MNIKSFNAIIWLCLFMAFNSFNGIQMAALSRSENLKSSIENVQKKFANSKPSALDELKSETKNVDATMKVDTKNADNNLKDNMRNAKLNDLDSEDSVRYNKMLDYFGYYPQPMMPSYPTPFYPQNFYDDFNNIDDEDMMSRANRRKPSSSQNSPIFYIRLPPTPYMFVPGMGYISQPPTIQPIATQFQMPPPMPHVPMNPFINLPINFISNGKPTNVYQWNTAQSPSGLGNGYVGPQYPSYLPTRPHRPPYRPKPFIQDSKITHLKGPFVFNGRPEDVFILPNNPYNSPYNSPYSNGYNNPAFSNPGYNPYSTPYNAPYNSIYSDQLQSFY